MPIPCKEPRTNTTRNKKQEIEGEELLLTPSKEFEILQTKIKL
jgi:hypothetical protein